MTSDLAKLQNSLGMSFRNTDLLKEAMTHKSYASEKNVKYDNQRLEFLGDAVLQIILTKYLFTRYPESQEGDLTKMRSALANQETLASFAKTLSLGEYLMLGKGESDAKGQERESTLSDAFEALLGAIYLDVGLDPAEKFLLDVMLKHYPDPTVTLTEINPKGTLQEYAQRTIGKTPEYKITDVSGPPHDPCYVVELFLDGKFIAKGSAQSRKNAERAAAKIALQEIMPTAPETKE